MKDILPSLSRWVSRLSGSQQPVNSYLCRSPAGTILIDPAADLTPSVVGNVTDIFITHLQEENAAGCLNCPGARVHVPVGDEYLCGGRQAYEKVLEKWQAPWEWETRGNYQGHMAGARNERPLRRFMPLAESLRPGHSILGCEILATPGHGKNAVTILAVPLKLKQFSPHHRVSDPCGGLDDPLLVQFFAEILEQMIEGEVVDDRRRFMRHQVLQYVYQHLPDRTHGRQPVPQPLKPGSEHCALDRAFRALD